MKTQDKRYKLPLAVAAITASACFGSVAEEALFLEEVVVTAQKRAQSLQDVPMSVSAVTDAAIKNAGISSLDEVKNLVPALNIYSAASPAMSSIAIRGAGTGASDPTLEPSVGVFVDGVFMPRSVFGMSDLVDIDRVEVLLGPQGTLYGKNTNAGVVSVHTKDAPSEFEAEVEVSLGEDNLQETKLSIGDVLTDGLGYRVAAVSRLRDGFMSDEISGDDHYNQLDRQAYRGQVFWEPNDIFSVRTIAYYSLSDANGSENELEYNPASAYYGYLGALGQTPGIDSGDRKVSLTQPGGGRLEVQGASVQLDYELGSGLSLTSITAYQEWEQDNLYSDGDGTALPILATNDRMDEQSISQELRLTSPGGETVDWVAGLFYFKSNMHRGSQEDIYAQYGGLPFVASPVALAAVAPNLIEVGDYAFWENKYETESLAVFGQATWNITENTSLTAGLRYGEEDKDFAMHVSSYDVDGTLFNFANWFTGDYTGGSFVPLTSGSLTTNPADFLSWGPVDRENDRSDDDVTGMLSLNHTIDDAMLYATVSTGSKSGGFNGSFGPAGTDERGFEQEDTINYEVGAKIDGLLDGRMRLNLAYFYTEYKDFQAATFDPTTVSFFVINAGKQVTQGVDLDLTYMVSESLTLTTKLEYLDAKYKDFEGANCHALTGGPGCDQSGMRMPFAANWTGSVALDYSLPLNNDDEIYAHVGMSFKSDHSADPTFAPYAEGVNYELWDARFGWRNDNWDISIWGKNLTDETYTQFTSNSVIASLFNAADAGASSLNHRRWINDPRSVGITARYNF